MTPRPFMTSEMASTLTATMLDCKPDAVATKEDTVAVVVNVLDREEGVDRDIALLIADGVYNSLKSSNVRECVRIARLAKNDSARVNRIVDTFAKYGLTTKAV
jgi:hypothetical protein